MYVGLRWYIEYVICYVFILRASRYCECYAQILNRYNVKLVERYYKFTGKAITRDCGNKLCGTIIKSIYRGRTVPYL